MKFSRPEVLHALWLAPLIPLFFRAAFRSADRARRQLLSDDLAARLAQGLSPSRRRWKAVLQGTALVLIAFALAGPRVGSREVTVKRRGIDLLIALDTSLSMMARDVAPSRLGKARREVSAFLDRLDGDRVGLVAFAGGAHLQCPLTLDYGAARMFLEVLDIRSVSRPGTNLGAAIRSALSAFGSEVQDDKHRALVLVTDGDDPSGGGVQAAEEAARRGIRIFTIGIGSGAGEPIPMPDDDPSGVAYKKDRSGEIVMTALDEEVLERIASITGGSYHHATRGELELDRIHEEIAGIEEREVASRKFTQFEPRFQVPLAIALLLLLVDLVLPERVRRSHDWEGRFA
ncbi:MAG: VWA domain-containing protein [Gemmatimonadota bacterium]|jgi:Ca-activated chloride channel family protein|nr:hypothetical protein [Gemmatimonadota bacterium]MDP6530203.1 VWA domain-containing protein [Gemmatimonadota bacterium]MDP6801599.1 VWA domain-containing protein [Gemmatimonadota bacterium]MDP7030854.1 VWA domain-containing protein [Gemmatimonadota bacterium]